MILKKFQVLCDISVQCLFRKLSKSIAESFSSKVFMAFLRSVCVN